MELSSRATESTVFFMRSSQSTRMSSIISLLFCPYRCRSAFSGASLDAEGRYFCLLVHTQLKARETPDLDVLAGLADGVGDELLNRLGAIADRSLLEQHRLLPGDGLVIGRQLVLGDNQGPGQ